MFELCGNFNFLSTNKFLYFNFVEFCIRKINFYILNFLDLFWTNYLLLKKKLKIENWWIVLTNKFLCFNFAECVLEKLIFTFELFAIFFQLFFSFQLVEFFFGQIKLSFMLQLLWKAFLNFFFLLEHLSTRLKAFACGWKVLESLILCF